MVWLLFVALYVLESESLFVREATVLVLELSVLLMLCVNALFSYVLRESVVA